MPTPGPTEERTTVLIHVGCRKSGTSALQLGLQRASDDLRGQGLVQPLGGRGGITRGLIEPARRGVGGDPDGARQDLADLARAIRESGQPRHLISLEALAEWTPAMTSLAVEALAEFDTRIVITARPWAVTIPSEWQQRVKSRFSGSYADYVEAIRHPDQAEGVLADEARDFRRRQDVADVARRWRAADPDLPVHVVLVPTDRGAHPGLTELFCGVVGISPDDLPVPGRMVNESLSHEHTEVLRRVNLALGDRLTDLRGNYRYSVRKWIAVGAMMGQPGARIRLPADLEDWASEEAQRQVDELCAMECQVHGDPRSFVHPTLPGSDFEPATDKQVADAAAAVLARLAQGHERERRKHQRQQRNRRSRRNRSRQRREGGPGPTDSGGLGGPAGPVHGRLRGVARRVRARLSR